MLGCERQGIERDFWIHPSKPGSLDYQFFFFLGGGGGDRLLM